MNLVVVLAAFGLLPCTLMGKASASSACPIREILTVGPYSLTDTEYDACKSRLYESSTTMTNLLSQANFVSYVNTAFAANYASYDALTPSLQRAYTISACNCLPNSLSCENDCSSIDLNVSEAALFKVCGRIQYGYDIVDVPTMSPLATPSISPTVSLTMKPSLGETSQPTLFTGSADLTIEYGMDTNVYLTPESILSKTDGYGIQDSLLSAMSTTVSDVLKGLGYSDDGNSGGRFLRQSARKLIVTNPSNVIDNIESNGCDIMISDPTSACYIVTSTVSLEIVDENKGNVLANVLQALEDVLSTSFLQHVQDSSTVVVQITPDPTTQSFSPPTPSPEPAEPLHPGIYAAIALSAAAFVLTGAIYYKRKRDQKMAMYTNSGVADNRLGADDINFVLHGNDDKNRFSPLDDSGSEGGSGWSSNGTSPSNDARKDYVHSLAAVAVASGATGRYGGNDNVARKISDEDDDDASESSSQMIKEMLPITNLTNAPAVTRQDLDRAIDAGDWAAVGATAALLSHQKDEHHVLPDQDKAAKSLSITRSHMSDLDLQRAKELDHLVDTGDWEGIVLTAAKYESLPVSQSDESASLDPTTYTFNASVGSDTYGNNRKRDEIRAEVEDLVRKVVPDEAENIDEMMRQFYGREEELLETLRSMQERAIAQRQRLAVQKNAKREATTQSTRQNTEQAPSTSGDAQDKDATSTVFSDPQFDGIQALGGGSSSGGTKKEETEETEVFGGVPTSIRPKSKDASSTDEKQRLLQIEEEQALAQAEIWEKIAAANAHGVGDSKEASAAADWAIARSLQTLEGENGGHTDLSHTKDSITEEDEV